MSQNFLYNINAAKADKYCKGVKNAMTQQEILDKMRFDMELRNLRECTIHDYLLHVRSFQNHFGKPADQMREPDIQEYLHYLLHTKRIKPSSVNTYNASIRFLFVHTLDISLNFKKIPRVKVSRSFPDLPVKSEMVKIFDAAPSFMYKAIFMTIYGSGLRVSEAANLKISDIDSKNMRIIIRGGKGGRDRYAMLPEATLTVLREYYKQYRPKEWLFWTRVNTKMSVRAIQDAFNTAVERSGINKRMTVHTLRHAYATHLLESGVNLIAIKQLLGHVRLDTTAWYARLADSEVLELKSPIDSLPQKRGRKPKQSVIENA